MNLARRAKYEPAKALGLELEFGDEPFVEKIQQSNSRNIIPFGVSFLDDA